MNWNELIKSSLHAWKEEGLGRELQVEKGISFSHNDYLDLSRHPEILEAGVRALRDEGAGSKGSRLLGGNSKAIEAAEERIAEFFHAPSALFFPSGYQANLGIVRAVGELAEKIYSDEKNHASLIDAIQLTRKGKVIVPHLGWWPLLRNPPREKIFIASESVFSMDGDNVMASGLFEFAEATDSFLLLDEAHAAGIYGEEGRGFFEKEFSRAAVVITFGKAFGVAGAAVLCTPTVKEWLVNRARTFIYTTAPSPAIPAMVKTACDVLTKESWRGRELKDRAGKVRGILEKTGQLPFPGNEWERVSPILPFLVPGEEKALRFCENMRKSGFDLRLIRYPTVPRGQERIRVSLNLRASAADCENLAREMVRQWTA